MERITPEAAAGYVWAADSIPDNQKPALVAVATSLTEAERRALPRASAQAAEDAVSYIKAVHDARKQSAGATRAAARVTTDAMRSAFFQQLQQQKLEHNNTVLRLPDGYQLVFGHACPPLVYVRKAYHELEQEARVNKRLLIVGTPGTGKSTWLIYLIWRLWQQGGHGPQVPPVSGIVYRSNLSNTVLRIARDCTVEVFSAVDYVPGGNDPHQWHLYDSCPQYLTSRGHIIVVSSPAPRLYKEFIKQSAETRFLRLWGWEEIEDCRSKVHPHIPRLLAWLLFNLFYGGSARAIFGSTARTLPTQQQQPQPKAGACGAAGSVEGGSLTHPVAAAAAGMPEEASGITPAESTEQISQGPQEPSAASHMSRQSEQILSVAAAKLWAWHEVVAEVLNTIRAEILLPAPFPIWWLNQVNYSVHAVDSMPEESHDVLHIDVEPHSCPSYRIKFATWFEETLYMEHGKWSKWLWLSSRITLPWVKSLEKAVGDYIFERLTLCRLADGGAFRIWLVADSILTLSKRVKKPHDQTLDLGQTAITTFSDFKQARRKVSAHYTAETAAAALGMMVPKDRYFLSVDAVQLPNRLFRVAASGRKELRCSSLQELLNALPESPEYHLYFVMPQRQQDGFRASVKKDVSFRGTSRLHRLKVWTLGLADLEGPSAELQRTAQAAVHNVLQSLKLLPS